LLNRSDFDPQMGRGLGLVENDLDRLRLGHRRAVRLLGHIHASRLDQSDDLTKPYRPANSRISRRILRISAADSEGSRPGFLI
jgi:hypothetical protein